MLAERIYRALLLAYPEEHRREFGEPMVQLFRDRMRRDGGGLATLAVWVHTLLDLVRSASRERMEAAGTEGIGRSLVSVLLMRGYTAKTARTQKQVILSLLIPVICFLVLVAAASILLIFFPDTNWLEDAILQPALYMLGGWTVLNPVLHGLTFRLRTKYDLKNSLRTIIIYLPICVFFATVLVHTMSAFLSGKTPLVAITWFEIALAFYLGSLMCILPVLAHRAGVASEPAPAITTHRFYWQTERAVSLGSVLGLSVLFLFAL